MGIWLDGGEQFGGKSDGSCCGCDNGDAKGLEEDYGGEYSMDYYAQDGGECNSSYVKKATRPVRRNVVFYWQCCCYITSLGHETVN